MGPFSYVHTKAHTHTHSTHSSFEYKCNLAYCSNGFGKFSPIINTHLYIVNLADVNETTLKLRLTIP